MTATCQRVGLAILLIALVAPAAIAQQTGTLPVPFVMRKAAYCQVSL